MTSAVTGSPAGCGASRRPAFLTTVFPYRVPVLTVPAHACA
jgi:hypothetical protein